ncbi:MAG: hypothetical protein IKR18_10785 [Bacteroidaceae bacterium]|nr:hypothetical protein [Bacteroidaceae bacterium]
MKILFEEYKYQTEDVKDILSDFVLSGLDLTKKTQQLRYVGYFFNKNIENHDGSKGDLVFILLKVILDSDGNAFGVSPLKILDFNYRDWKSDDLIVEEGSLSKRNVYDFIYGFATWIYRAVDIYRKSHRSISNEEQDDSEAEVMTSLQVGKAGKKEKNTFMDILLSLLDFQRTHKNFITFVMKIAHSGYNKVSWPKTISQTQAIIQDESPIYLRLKNKKKFIDFDEELLIIYYSILDYMHEEFGFPIPNQPGYKLIKGGRFKSYLKSQGKTRLHKIRYKYYSDDAISLWNLCFAFFDKADELKAQTNHRDYLLINKFETVFEAMIEELIGDKNLPDGLKVGGDDKRIDHLYTYKYLLEKNDGQHASEMNRNVYNIADSKYYRRDKMLRGHDVPKQFTYARNVIQWHMDLLHGLLEKDIEKAEKYKDVKLFDPVTEGYNIIPNFFISAQVDENLSYDKANFESSRLGDGNNVRESYIFWERLFDRNSYFTLHYDVNFLFIMKMYAQNKSHNKATWKMQVREKFRKGILEFLNETFNFYQIIVKANEIEDFVDRHYRKVAGKVFSFEDESGQKVLLYAERKEQSSGKGESYSFDVNNDSHVEGNLLFIPTKDKVALYRVQNVTLGDSIFVDTDIKYQESALVGYYKSKEHLDWIMNNGIYNIPTKQRGVSVRVDNSKLYATHVILHNDELGNYVFRIVGETLLLMKKANLPQGDYSPNHDEYYIYKIDVEKEIDKPLEMLIASKRFQNKLKHRKPMAIKMEALRELSKVIPIDTLLYKFEEEETFSSMVAEDSEDTYIS